MARAALVGGASAALIALGMVTPAHAAAGGANTDCGAYCATDVGAPSGNGNAAAHSKGLPGAGTKGKADNKFPPGQSPDGNDNNNGYECDGNRGIGRTNPAHTGCDGGGSGYPGGGGSGGITG